MFRLSYCQCCMNYLYSSVCLRTSHCRARLSLGNMAAKFESSFGVIVFLLSLFTTFCREIKTHHEYCVVGAGPGGLQIAYFLKRSNRDYIVFERNSEAGSFYKFYPRHRGLISINKRHTGKTNKEFNMRHDWNSLLSDDESLRMTRYSKMLFPKADVLVQYLNDFATKLNLKISYNTEVKSVSKQVANNSFILQDQNGFVYTCDDLIVSTGIPIENIPDFKGIEHTQSYGEMSLDREDYEGQTVLILGGGNAAFETADFIMESTNVVHVMGRSRVRLAWSTHYVGDVRAVNNRILDNYQLKSLDGYLEKSFSQISIVKHNGRLYVDFYDTKGKILNKTGVAPDNYSLREPYDKILRCLGFRFDFSIFNDTVMPNKCEGKKSKYPLITPDYQSDNVPRLWFGGATAHSLDWKKSAGGFIHGYRYTARSLHRILEWRNHGVKWKHHIIPQSQILNYITKRVNEASGIYQMFGILVDVVIYVSEDQAIYIEEFPLKLLDKFERYSGLPSGPTIVVNMEYGKSFSGAGRDTFHEDRATLDPSRAHISNFLHPVLYFYRQPVKAMGKDYSLPKPDRIHHIVEDFLTKWTGPFSHLVPLRRFLEHLQGEDLRNFFSQSCFKLAMTHTRLPRRCNDYFLKGSSLPGESTLIDFARAQSLLV
ncbi:FAD-dependent oxidoreductase domain-containing protein 2-like [Dendronephthya gigantea]|uniref:FAD-dependent oxidoreductase domain-containing protein 2-like n=1 Tax=Dendronephthya gigantea TaxID=151771 RepID=UPI001069BCA8|nr:FAD-dependent oxidoreductase domain-containing protein 2-like [Dendronephthya gigantea]